MASGARLVGPSIIAPLVVSVGVIPYVSTSSGKPYGTIRV